MKIFDLHADIGFDIYNRHKLGERDIFINHHLDKLEKGDFVGVGVACFFEGHENWKDMQACVLAVKEDLISASKKINVMNNAKNFDDNQLNLLMTIEGMCGIQEDECMKIDWLYQQGVRIASLTWNDENYLATGVQGNPLRGLSEAGKKAVLHMNKIGMVIDVSHTNEKSFWDIIETSQKPVIATHSNVREIFMVERSLTNQQIKAIAAKGGIIGVVAAKYFVAGIDSNRNAYHLAKHAKYIAELVGVEHVAIGFDFMDFLEEEYKDSMIYDVPNASAAQVFIQALSEVGFSKKEIEKIAYKNVEKFLKKYI